jgi:hypothetical protein
MATTKRYRNEEDHEADDIDVEKLNQQLSDIYFPNSDSNNDVRVYDYKHDEEGRLIFQNKRHHHGGIAAISGLVEKLHGRQIYKMNTKEREAIDNEIHCVESRSVQESPSMIFSALHEMRKEIDENLEQELEENGEGQGALFRKEAHKRGLQIHSHYIQSDEFRIRFLRAELFDVQKAAVRYFRFLDVLHSFFGDEALTRPLFLQDLTKRERQYLKNGHQQLLRSRDRSGRRIYVWLGFSHPSITQLERFRTATYLLDVLAQDEETQQLGHVLVMKIPRSGRFTMTAKSPQYWKRTVMSSPVRPSALHICVPDSFIMQIIQPFAFWLLDARSQSILRFHGGSQIENNYHLGGFGMKSRDIPMAYDGKIKTKNVTRFIQARTMIEAFQKKQIQTLENQQSGLKSDTTTSRTSNIGRISGSKIGMIECPGTNCVVFGDKNMFEHTANVRFRRMLLVLERQRMERIVSCDQTLAGSVSAYVDEIVDIALSLKNQQDQQEALRFYAYEKDQSVYREIVDKAELHKRILPVLRDFRKRHRENRLSLDFPEATNQAVQALENLRDVAEGSSILGLTAYKRTKKDKNGFCPC